MEGLAVKIFRRDADVVEYRDRCSVQGKRATVRSVTGPDDMNFAVVKHGSGVAKDEVHATLNI